MKLLIKKTKKKESFSYLHNLSVVEVHFYTMVLFPQNNQLLLYKYYVFDFDYQQMEKHNQLYLK